MSDYQKLLEMWREEKQKRQQLEKENNKLKEDLKTEKLDREYDKSVHTQEIEDLMKGKLKK
tara:strand:- start:3507 stop:3689 length:183 start_codon:yes stop_codon:yes gene_type:complete